MWRVLLLELARPFVANIMSLKLSWWITEALTLYPRWSKKYLVHRIWGRTSCTPSPQRGLKLLTYTILFELHIWHDTSHHIVLDSAVWVSRSPLWPPRTGRTSLSVALCLCMSLRTRWKQANIPPNSNLFLSAFEKGGMLSLSMHVLFNFSARRM